MPRLEEVANVALRVPSILVLDLLYKCDIEGLTDRLKAKNEDMLFKYKYLIWNLYYIGECSHVRPEPELWCVSVGFVITSFYICFFQREVVCV